MDQEIINAIPTYYLPEELIHEILSRIPITDVCACKRVCKSWLKLIETPEFTRSHLSKSVPGLLISHLSKERTVSRMLEIKECSRLIELDVLNKLCQDRGGTQIEGSIDGLIFFRKTTQRADDKEEQYYICNPITREYVQLPMPKGIQPRKYDKASYGFGINGKSGQYKVVRMFERAREFICQVYTLGGAGTWRGIAITHDDELLEGVVHSDGGTYLNGNLHWLMSDSGCMCWWVSCFDLETEAFSKFRAPTSELDRGFGSNFGVIRGCLCLCDEDHDSEGELVVYTMSCYEKKCWVKECVIRKSPDIFGEMYDQVYPLKVFGDRDGGLLVALQDMDCNLFCYSSNANGLTGLTWMNPDHRGYFEALFYTPSFVSLGGLFETSVVKYY